MPENASFPLGNSIIQWWKQKTSYLSLFWRRCSKIPNLPSTPSRNPIHCYYYLLLVRSKRQQKHSLYFIVCSEIGLINYTLTLAIVQLFLFPSFFPTIPPALGRFSHFGKYQQCFLKAATHLTVSRIGFIVPSNFMHQTLSTPLRAKVFFLIRSENALTEK